MKQYRANEECELVEVATDLLAVLLKEKQENQSVVLTLSGDLGAGKTALVKALAKALGVSEVVVSPTFVLLKKYETSHEDFSVLVHIDAYRVEDTDELTVLHFDDVLKSKDALVCIEWPEKIPTSLNTPHLAITISEEKNGERVFTVTKKQSYEK